MNNFKYYVLLCGFVLNATSLADVIGTQTAATALVLQSNGRPVVTGFANSCDRDQVMIARYLTDGTPDGTLNGTGNNLTLFGGNASGKAITLQTDQKIVVAGYSDNTIGLLRYTTAGILDSTFGTNGRVNLNLGLDETGNAVAMQSGKILVAGGATVAGVTQFFVCRFNATGVLDTGFGTSGITTTLIGDGCAANAMGIQSNGKIVLAGGAVVSGEVVIALSRYSSSGVLDATFGTGGTTYTPVGIFALGSALAVDSSNKLIVTGFTINGGTQQVCIVRFTSNGTLDGTFGTSGVVLIDIPATDPDRGTGVAIQADGNIVVAGKSGTDILVARLDGTDGALDTTFGGGAGYVLTTIGDDAGANAIAVQPGDQMLVVAGFSDLSVVLARYDVDGNLDTTFGDLGSGWIIQPQGSLEALCGTCTVCPTGPQGPTGVASLGSYAYFYNSALSLNLNLAATTPVPFDAEGIKNNITHSTVTDNDQITIVTTGIYKATAVIDLSVALLGSNFALLQNGVAIAGTTFGLAGVGTTVVQATFAATAGDVIQVAQLGVVATTVSGNTSITLEQIA